MKHLVLLTLLLLIFGGTLFGQTVVTGVVTDDANQTILHRTGEQSSVAEPCHHLLAIRSILWGQRAGKNQVSQPEAQGSGGDYRERCVGRQSGGEWKREVCGGINVIRRIWSGD